MITCSVVGKTWKMSLIAWYCTTGQKNSVRFSPSATRFWSGAKEGNLSSLLSLLMTFSCRPSGSAPSKLWNRDQVKIKFQLFVKIPSMLYYLCRRNEKQKSSNECDVWTTVGPRGHRWIRMGTDYSYERGKKLLPACSRSIIPASSNNEATKMETIRFWGVLPNSISIRTLQSWNEGNKTHFIKLDPPLRACSSTWATREVWRMPKQAQASPLVRSLYRDGN